MRQRSAIRILLVTCAILTISGQVRAGNEYDKLGQSIVKIYVSSQRYDYLMPWQTQRPRGATGSGFVLKNKRLLTNAHVVSDARYIEVKKEGDPRRYRAHVAFVGHDCDLAMLKVEDPTFFAGTRPVTFANQLPELSDTVVVLGYPMGGERLSLTEGVVSRIDYSVYSHAGVDSHLALQVDAAINPGNSGGPVFFKHKVVGVAFQGLSSGDNIGYAIPVPVIHHFLEDTEDGTYNGYPEMGISTLEMRNPAMHKALGLPAQQAGVAISFVDPFGSAYGRLEDGDVVLEIDGYDVAEDGSIVLDGNTVEFTELTERRQWGETVSCIVWRDGERRQLQFPLDNPPDPFIYRNVYNERPRYLTTGGLVFTPLSRELLKSLGRGGIKQKNGQQLLYVAQYAKIDGLYKDHDEFVVLTRRLPHPVNTYTSQFLNGILLEVNGRSISRLEDMPAALAQPIDGYHVMHFSGIKDDLVLSAAEVAASDGQILRQYGVPAPYHLTPSASEQQTEQAQ